MNYEVEINGGVRHVSITRADGAFHVTVDGRRVAVDAARIDAHSWSLIVGGEVRRTFEITIAPDQTPPQVAVGVGPVRLPATVNGRRRFRKEAAAHAAAGPLRVVAPMPGKIVRVLVQSGETVRARQPLVVVEAMKMENELRAGRAGTVAEVRAHAGQSVDAGAVLVVVQ